MDASVKKIPLTIGSHSYNIVIGSEILSTIDFSSVMLSPDKTGYVVSERVWGLYRDYISQVFSVKDAGDFIVMNDGEENKNYRYAEQFFEWLLGKGFTRKSMLVAIGGGVVGDFAGYCAALFMRGIPVVHVPTTLLAMVDSSIGGKVAVNISAGKNIVGVFYQPAMVLSDVRFLATLPDGELKNGITETVKHALIGESSLLAMMLNHDLKSIKERDTLEEIIYLSAGFKAGVVCEDEKESGRRAILNFGHTIGHAIESVMEYRGISHGEAVAIGLKGAMEISREMGFITREDVSVFDECARRYELLNSEHRFDPADVIDHMKYDKKNYGGRINFVLLKSMGVPQFDCEVPEDVLKHVLSGL